MGSGFPLLLSLRRAAAGHRARGPCCPARRSCTASVGRGSGQKRPGLRVRRPALGEGQCLSAGVARSPALGLVNELHAPWQIHHVFTCTSPSRFLFWDISAFSETMHSALPTCYFCGQQPGAGSLGRCGGGAQRLPQPLWWFTPFVCSASKSRLRGVCPPELERLPFLTQFPFPGDSAVQLWMQWPGWAHWAQGQPPPGPGGDCISETSALKVKGQVDKRWLG